MKTVSNSQDIVVGTAHSSSPGVIKGSLRVADAPDGSPLEAPVVIVRGTSPGPVLWLHGCVHGNEYCGTWIIHELIASLDPAKLAGAVARAART